MKPYKVISVSFYVEQLVALDAKVEALKEAGYTRASRSKVLRLAMTHISDDVLVAALQKYGPKPESKPRKSVPQRRRRSEDYVCGACGIKGHNRRTCRGAEVESAAADDDAWSEWEG